MSPDTLLAMVEGERRMEGILRHRADPRQIGNVIGAVGTLRWMVKMLEPEERFMLCARVMGLQTRG